MIILQQSENSQAVIRLIFCTDYEKKYVIFSFNFA